MKRTFAIVVTLGVQLPTQLAAEPPARGLVDVAANAVGLAAEKLSAYDCSAEFQELLVRKRFDDAWLYAVREQERQPNSPHGWLLRCQVRSAEGKHDEALREAKEAVDRFPESAAALHVYAT